MKEMIFILDGPETQGGALVWLGFMSFVTMVLSTLAIIVVSVAVLWLNALLTGKMREFVTELNNPMGELTAKDCCIGTLLWATVHAFMGFAFFSNGGGFSNVIWEAPVVYFSFTALILLIGICVYTTQMHLKESGS